MNRLLCRCGVLLFVWLLLLHPQTFAAENQLAIVANPEVKDTLDKEEIKQIFLGKKTQWKDNSGITFVLFDNDELLTVFLKTYIGKSPEQFKNFWKKQVFTGKGKMPKAIGTPTELIKFLAETRGAIGFMRSEDVDETQVNILSLQP